MILCNLLVVELTDIEWQGQECGEIFSLKDGDYGDGTILNKMHVKED